MDAARFRAVNLAAINILCFRAEQQLRFLPHNPLYGKSAPEKLRVVASVICTS
jgi:hypothetical protein